MITTIIAIGNSRGIRIPKPILNESGLREQVELQVKKGEIRIVPAPLNCTSATTTFDATIIKDAVGELTSIIKSKILKSVRELFTWS